VLGIVAGPNLIVLFLLCFYLFVLAWGIGPEALSPERVAETASLLFGFVLFDGVAVSAIAMVIGLALALIYRRVSLNTGDKIEFSDVEK